MRRTLLVVAILLLMATIPASIEGKKTGKFGSGTGCSCHYAGGVQFTFTGVPNSYNPGASYTLNIAMTSTSYNHGGFSLDADIGVFSNPSTYAKVNSTGDSATHSSNGGTSWTVDWTAPQSGSGTATFDLMVIGANNNNANTGDGKGGTSVQSTESTQANQPPSVSSLSLGPVNPATTDTLTLSYSYSDAENDAESGTQIRWYRDGALISSLNDQSSVGSGSTAKGQIWNASVTPSDGADFGISVDSNTKTILNSAPTISSASIYPTQPLEGDDLTLSVNINDADSGDSAAISDTRWYVDGARISSFDGELTVPSVAVRGGDVWYAEIMASDGLDASQWFSIQSVTIGSSNTAPVMSSVSISPGTINTSTAMVAIWTSSDADAGDSEESAEVIWFLNGTEYPTITAATLPTSHTAKSQLWSVKVRVHDGEAWSEWLTSATTNIVNSPPVLESFNIDTNQSTMALDYNLDWQFSDADPNDTLELDLTTYVNNVSFNAALADYSIGDFVRIDARVWDGLDYSNIMSASFTVISAQPALLISGPFNPDSLSNLTPTIITYDLDGDDVSITYVWLKNGFATNLGNVTSVPADRLAPSDVWTLLATPNDGSIDGLTISQVYVIANIEPQAKITTEAEAWISVPTILSASTSIDVDGVISDALWVIDGQEYGGLEISIAPTSTSTDVLLVVYDDNGASSNTTISLSASPPPSADDLRAEKIGNSIVITWEGSAENWAVYRDGISLGQTSSNTWTDLPTVVGIHQYQVHPIVDETVVASGPITTAELTVDDVAEAAGPEAGFGTIFGLIMILAGGAGIASAFIPRRD
ncbi:MAG: hypothetical protein HOE92_05090 [Euryarchaeota archaeon]|nr:hypothetical protein [Euryarchaeota archaeon]